jgi:hypothetical protein
MAYKNRTERVAEIREELKREFPDFKFSIRKDGYNGVRIAILSAPINLLEGEPEGTKYVDVNNYYIDENFKDVPAVRDVLKKIYGIASRGVTYRETGDYGTQPDFYVYIKIGEYDKPFEFIPKKGRTPRATSGASTPSSSSSAKWDRGEVIRECAGWKVYKKTLPDGRLVYNAVKDKETPSNKGDWNAIRGEIYTETGFKWGRFGAFEKWGEITESRGEKGVLDELCEILTKYYAPSSTPSTPESTPAPMPSKPEGEITAQSVADFLIHLNNYAFETLNIESGGQLKQSAERDELQKKYGQAMDTLLGTNPAKAYIEELISFGGQVRDILEDLNEHSLNNYLGLRGYYGPMVISEYQDFYKESPRMFLNPANFIVEEQKTTSKEDLRKAIAGLQILADKGNEKAKKAIIGLKILLNK